MSESFDYVNKLSALTLEQKRKFYVLLAHNLTVSIRVVWSEENLTDTEKVEGMKWINEIMHHLIFRNYSSLGFAKLQCCCRSCWLGDKIKL